MSNESDLIAKYGLTYGEGIDLNTRYAATAAKNVMVVGFNPGAGGRKRGEAIPVEPAPPGLSRSEKNWRTRCANLARALPHEVALIELIDIPSYDVGELADHGHDWKMELKRNAGNTLAKIQHHQPKIIFQTGISPHHLAVTIETFQLKGRREILNGQRLAGIAFNYDLGERTVPWLAVRHLSQNFSKDDRNSIHNFIDTHLNFAGVARRLT